MHSNSQQSGFFLTFIICAQRKLHAGKQEVCWKHHKKSQLNTVIFFVYIYKEAETIRKCCHHSHLLLRHSYASWFNITHATFFFTDLWHIISTSLKYLLRKYDMLVQLVWNIWLGKPSSFLSHPYLFSYPTFTYFLIWLHMWELEITRIVKIKRLPLGEESEGEILFRAYWCWS